MQAGAKDIELISYATEIRLRAERRAGEILREMGERRGKQNSRRDEFSTNKALGITDNQSSRWQQLAALNRSEFEDKVERGKRKATRLVRTGRLDGLLRCASVSVCVDPASSR